MQWTVKFINLISNIHPRYVLLYTHIYIHIHIQSNMMLHQPALPLNKAFPLLSYLFDWHRATLLQFGHIFYMFIYTYIYIDIHSLCMSKHKSCWNQKRFAAHPRKITHIESTSPWLLSGEGTKLWGCLDKQQQHLQRSHAVRWSKAPQQNLKQ